MRKRKTIRTTHKEIVTYWGENLPISSDEMNIINWDYAYTHCWNCGANKATKNNSFKTRLQRSHIIADSLGGKDEPSNYVLLCSECHPLSPGTSNPDDMWDWIRSNYIPMAHIVPGSYKMVKALKKFEQDKGVNFYKELGHLDDIKSVIMKEVGKTSSHLSYKTEATYYYLFKNMLSKYGIKDSSG